MELNSFKKENQELVVSEPEKYLIIIEKDINFIRLRLKTSLFKHKWKETLKKYIIQKCLVLNSIGCFEESIALSENITVQHLDMSTEENCNFSFTSLYTYTEALINLRQLTKAKAQYKNLKNVFESWETKYNYDYSANYLLRLTSAIIDYYDGNKENARMEFESILNHSMELDKSIKSIIYYYFAIIDYDDDNFIDSIRKLNISKKESNKFYYKMALDLEKQIEKKKLNLNVQGKNYCHNTFKEFGENESIIMDLQLNSDGSMVATVDAEGCIKVWNTNEEHKIAEFSDNKEMFMKEYAYKSNFCFSKDSNLLAFGIGIGIVKIYDLQLQKIKASYNLYAELDYDNLDTGAYYYNYTYTHFSYSGNYLLIVPSADRFDPQGEEGIGYSNPIYFRRFFVLDTENGQILFDYTFNKGKIGSICFSNDERFIAAGVFGKELKLWDTTTFKEIYSDDDFVWIADPCRIGMTNNIVFGADNSSLVYSSNNHYIKLLKFIGHDGIFDVEAKTLNLPSYAVSCALEFDSNINRIISADFYDYNRQTEIRILDTTNNMQISSAGIKRAFTQQIVLNIENDELWILYPPVIEIRKYSTLEIIKIFNPYKWYNSSYMLGNSASINKNGNSMAIAFENKIRFHS